MAKKSGVLGGGRERVDARIEIEISCVEDH